MANKAHDHLHRLIRSMSPAEKRYFKLHTSRVRMDGPSDRQRLFDVIAAMETYDETDLLRRFQGQAFTRRFAITKHRLYESILNSLEAFHAEGSIDARLNRQLHQVEILHQRALYDDAEKLLHNTARMARQYDRQAILVAVAEQERRLAERGNYASLGPERLDVMERAGRELREELQELETLWNIKSHLLIGLYRRGQARRDEVVAGSRNLLREKLPASPLDLRSAKARYLYHHIHSAAAFALGDLSVCHRHLSMNHMLLREAPQRFTDLPNLLLGVLSNLVHVCMVMGRNDEAHAHLRELRTMPSTLDLPDSEDLELRLFSTTTSLELDLLGHTGDFQKALELLPAVERGLSQHGDRLGQVRKAGFYFQLAYVHFGVGMPDMALQWLHRLFNDVRIDESAEIICFGRILQLMAAFDAGKTDLIPYNLRNTERSLRTRDRSHRFEKHFLRLMQVLQRGPGHTPMMVAFEQFRQELVALENDALERVVFDHLDPIAWADAHLTSRSFSEVVKERAQRNSKAA